MHLDDGREETPPRASSHHHHHLSLSYPLSVRKSLPCYSCRAEKRTLRRFGAFPASFGMEKKAEVLNSLSLSPLSETQRERERERAQTIDDFIPATLVTVARRRRRFLRFSERERAREKESELNEERSRESARDGEQQQHAEQQHPRRRRARGERRHLFPRGRFFARRWVESSQHVRTRTGDANRTDPGRAKFAPE